MTSVDDIHISSFTQLNTPAQTEVIKSVKWISGMRFSTNSPSIKAKLYGNAAIILLLLGTASAFAIFSLGKIGNELETIAEQDIPLTKTITQITEHQLEQAISFERALRYGELQEYRSGGTAQYEKAKSRFNELENEINQEFKQAEELARSAVSHAHTPKDVQEFKQIETALHKIDQEHHTFTKTIHEVFSLIEKGEFHAAEEMFAKVEKIEHQLNHETEELLHEVGSFTEEAGKRAKEHEVQALYILIIITGIALVLATLLNYFVVRNITKRLNLAVNELQAMTTGDLTQAIKVTGKDEIGQLQSSLQFLNSKFGSVVNDVKSAAGAIHFSTREIASGATEIAKQTESHATALQTASSSIEEITAVVQNTAGNASQANSLTSKAQTAAEQGESIVFEAIKVMDRANESSQKVADIIGTIDDIAFQTNLLALNAAVEAARAGDQGRGFAVVAAEVRNLAQQCAKSASQVKELIESSVKNVAEGSSLINQSGESLKEIVHSIDCVNKMISEISSASNEQAHGIEHINQNMVKIDDGTIRNAAQIEEMAVASESMSDLTKNLVDHVEFFEVDDVR